MFKSLFLICFCATAVCEEMDVAKISEAMGHIIGKNLDSFGLDFDLDAVVKGLIEESEGISSPLNEDECVQAIATLQEEKIAETTEHELEQVDAVSNGDQIKEYEDYPFSTPDSPKHR
ncbi:MAG: hypothetical protein COT85_04275 [Chlamydiae bacterium CG10_big_fil_rev_8_21_14_0_10_42_34]|nr:MAG: hypothetical protein COT85_04275 [Chlamydiae bacterium CG10_big_fil_rev_8_21_14_0_10_42_34]